MKLSYRLVHNLLLFSQGNFEKKWKDYWKISKDVLDLRGICTKKLLYYL